jgi:two-component system, NtrC family, sensor histidine kinase HydH
MTIRSAMLRAFLALVVGAILLSGALSFYEFRRSLQTEIARNLRLSAEALLGRIDAFFVERREDVEEWHRLEILEDIRVRDVDKRLARLLSDLKAGHGTVYRALYCTDRAGLVVAASDGAAPGALRPPAVAAAGPGTGEAAFALEPRNAAARTAGQRVVVRSEIPSALGGGTLGYLYAEVDWGEIERFLDEAVSGTGRTVLLLGADGRAIAAAGPLAEVALADEADLSVWGVGHGGGQPQIRDGAPLGAGPLLLGEAAPARRQHFAGFNWRLVMVEPTGIAFAPIWRLAWAILGVLLLTLAVAAWFAVRLSARIARPIGELTTFARALDLSRAPSPPHVESGLAEVRELNRAFGEMLEALGRSREHLIRAGKLAVVGEMAAIMAHEVRTPLGILKSSAQLLERRMGLTPADRELTAFIASETERLNRLVTTLLECASPRPPAFRPQDIHAVIVHVVSLLAGKAQKRAIALAVETGAEDPVVSCDREQMIQVFLNLLINAIQLVPEGGHIRVATADADAAILVLVEDDGPGVPDSDRERVFDPFFTRRDGGVGLGLTVVRQIVESHHGDISVSRGPFGGACFTIRLPRNEGGSTA